MPWHVVNGHSECPTSRPWAVVKDDTGEVEGCHPSREAANDQLAALNAAEADQEVVGLAFDIANGVSDDGEDLGGKPNPGTRRDRRLRRNRQNAQEGDMPDDDDCPPGQHMMPDGTCMPDEDMDLEGPFRPWSGVLAVEGVETGDGREFAPESLEWPTPPLPLMWQKEAEPQHNRSVVVGRIDDVERVGSEIRGSGVIRADAEVTEQIEHDMAGGISVDVDSVKETDVELVFPQDADEGAEEQGDDDDAIVMLFGPPPEKVVFHRGRIRGATLVALPAFVEARIQLTDGIIETEEETVMGLLDAHPQDDSLTAAASNLTGVAPLYPPNEWFTDPGLDGPTSWTITDLGRVYGHLALWSSCHQTFPDRCITPPRERDYPYFMRRELKTSEGDFVGTGPITLGTGHAALRHGAVPAVQHYDDTGLAAVDVAVGEDRYGIWVAGALRPTLSETRLRELRGAALSGDWRRIAGKLRLVAVLAVNVPGYPVPRMRAQVADDQWSSLVAAGVVTEARTKLVKDALASEDADGTIRVRRVRS